MTAERCGMGDRQRRWWRGLPVIAALGALLGSLALAPSPVSAVPTESGPTVSPAYSGGPRYTPLERVGSSRFSSGENLARTPGFSDGTFGYFATQTFPARIVKMRLSDMN
jgi:hypothetical protein